MRGHADNDAAGAAHPPVVEAEFAEARNGASKGVLIGAVGAAAVAIALAWWIGRAPDRGMTVESEASLPRPAATAQAPAPLTVDPQPNPEQVRRAYDQVREIYAAGGAEAVGRFTRDCAESVATDPRVLDFCLAFDIYGAAVSGEPALDRQALAARVLPSGVDAAGRVAAVQALTGVQTRTAAAPQPAESRPSAESRPAAVVRKAEVSRRAGAEAKAKAPATAAACRLRPTPADRTICARPSLRVAERRMKAAYDQAIAAGADRLRLDADQARFRAEIHAAADDWRRLGGLLEQRTRELRAEAARSP